MTFGELIILGLAAFVAVLFQFWSIINITKSRFLKPRLRTIFLYVVLFFPVLGSVFYFIQREKYTTKEKREFKPRFN